MISIINPREVGREKYFTFESITDDGYQIDTSTSDNLLSVEMLYTSQLIFVTAGMADLTNGAVTTYNMSITPNTFIQNGDILEFNFPEEVLLPQSTNIDCTGEYRYVRNVQCLRNNEGLVKIKFISVVNIVSGVTFKLYFPRITWEV